MLNNGINNYKHVLYINFFLRTKQIYKFDEIFIKLFVCIDKIIHRSCYLTAEISQSLHLETIVVSVINST